MSRTQTSTTKSRSNASSSTSSSQARTPGQPFYNVQMTAHSSVLPTATTRVGPGNIPLNLLAHVIQYLDNETPTLASLCRTSRVLYYMTLPHLWKRLRLRSYKGFRQRDDGRVEGFGGGSPFSMGLNALVTHSVSGLVRELELTGERGCVREEEEASQVGRVSENSMILAIVVRAAVDKCTGLESFKWNMDTRLMSNVFAGLGVLQNLESLWLRFPSTRCPGPTSELPVLPNLKEFTFTEYDPLCYPDDMSKLLENASKLEVLLCHFSPRMREQGEPSVQLSYLFRRNVASRKKLKLRKLGIWNLYARAEQPEVMSAIAMKNIEEFTSLNSFGPDEGETGGPQGVRTSFLDRSWLEDYDEEEMPLPRSIRMDQLHKVHAQGLACGGLEKLYLVNARYGQPVSGLLDDVVESSPSEASGSKLPTPSSISSTSTPAPSLGVHSSRELYFDSICKYAGPTLRHLIFPAKWPLTSNQLARLIRSCPRLTQLSFGVQEPNMEHLRMITPFLTELYAIRIVIPTKVKGCALDQPSHFEKMVDKEDAIHENKIMEALLQGDFKQLRYIGMGRKLFAVGGFENATIRVEKETEEGKDGQPEYREEVVSRRIVKRIGPEGVREVEIFKCDTLDVL